MNVVDRDLMGHNSIPWIVPLTLDPYLIMLSANQGGIKNHFWVVSMTWPGIEPRSPGPWRTLNIAWNALKLYYSQISTHFHVKSTDLDEVLGYPYFFLRSPMLPPVIIYEVSIRLLCIQFKYIILTTISSQPNIWFIYCIFTKYDHKQYLSWFKLNSFELIH